MEILDVSKFSDYIPFTQDENFRSFPIIFPLHRMEILDVSKISDYINFSKDGNTRRFEVLCLYSLSKEGYIWILRQKKITIMKSFVQFYYAHTEL